jgi:ATP-dependent RNA helicase DeaD
VIGKIDIMKSFSFFEVETVYMKPLLKSFKNARFDGIPVIVEISKPEEIKPKRHQ